MAKVLYHQDPQPVILEFTDVDVKEDKEKNIHAYKGKALVDAAGNVVVTNPQPGTEFGQYSTDNEAVKAAEAKHKADADKKAAEDKAKK
ncbi:MAG: hypothetical protein EOP87_00230 [Verrucomicrobiaceae bacterium]|nr:MAG: hypothetical protein EOP87_00230 [Verrucomicrobiaceae bacterium]